MIYRKGEDQSGLHSSALRQQIEATDISRSMPLSNLAEHHANIGRTGAENIVNSKEDVRSAAPGSIGPVSADHMNRAKERMSRAKATKSREMKRK